MCSRWGWYRLGANGRVGQAPRTAGSGGPVPTQWAFQGTLVCPFQNRLGTAPSAFSPT